ncbi:MAG: ABC transporter ATP-binding protein [Deltaproteobacteria bacterium]|nr:ABC transporter ATP-binding protein [Deltaproteobacteria bacterium]
MAEPLLVAEGLSRRFADVEAVSAVSFTVAKGEVVGFLGHNGAGKSTTQRMLAGALAPSAGRALVGGHASTSLAARRLIGWLPETPPLHPELTVEEQLAFAASLRGLTPARELPHLLERCGLGELRSHVNATLSKGTKQRVGLAQALAGDPPVLLLDEPTAGLDPAQAAAVRSLVRELGVDHAVLLSTHVVSEVAAVCDRALLLRRGALVLDERTEVLKGKGLEATVLGLLEAA